MLANDGRPNNAHVTKYDDNSCQAKITSRALWGYSETELRALSWVLARRARTLRVGGAWGREEGGETDEINQSAEYTAVVCTNWQHPSTAAVTLQ